MKNQLATLPVQEETRKQRKTTIMIIPELDVEEGYVYFEELDVALVAPWLMRKLISKEGYANA